MSFDPARVLRASQIRYGDIRLRGIPAILAGVAAVIVAGGLVRSAQVVAPSLAESLREAKNLVDALRTDRPRLGG